MEKRRTEDNVIILNSLHNKYVRSRSTKLYVAFVDFRKYFDSINRNCLFYKMLNAGITGQVYKIIKSAYTNNRYSIKTNWGTTQTFLSTSGVKQGCTLSPTLSNIYQNDLHEIFNYDCDPVELDGFFFNSLSWADDLVLVSKSKMGLQKCLDRLGEYCNKWQLSVNTEKTKIMVLSLGSSICSDIKYNGNLLEPVTTYKYLGFMISSNGQFNKMLSDRIEKAKKASFVIQQAISTTHNASVKLAMSLFEKQIEPILLYGCPIWSIPSSSCTIRVQSARTTSKIQ